MTCRLMSDEGYPIKSAHLNTDHILKNSAGSRGGNMPRELHGGKSLRTDANSPAIDAICGQLVR
jgi:hypothetical protein